MGVVGLIVLVPIAIWWAMLHVHLKHEGKKIPYVGWGIASIVILVIGIIVSIGYAS